MTEQQREAFEQWYNAEYIRPIIPADRTEGGYQHPDAQAAWDAWQAALSHAERREFKTEQDLISFLDGLYETAGPDSSALTGQKWVAAQRAIEGIRSHAEGEAVEPIGYLTLQAVARLQGDDRLNGEHLYAFDPDDMSKFRGVYLHPAPQVAGLTETAIKSSPAYRALHREKEHLLGLLKDQAPQVAVPEGWKLVPVEPTPAMLADFDGWREYDIPDNWSDAFRRPYGSWRAMLAAAPTAPAGEPVVWPEPQEATTIEEYVGEYEYTDGEGHNYSPTETERALILDAIHGIPDHLLQPPKPAQQPVSDPDGLTEPGRREAEQAYINCAFDYARDPIGSRDWVLFWNGWRARNAAPAPDEREIAARTAETRAETCYQVAREVEGLGTSVVPAAHRDWFVAVMRRFGARYDAEADRLRAGNDNDPGRTVKPHRSGGGLRPSESDSGHMGIATEPSVADRLRAGKEGE